MAASEPELEISNEFATVTIKKVWTRNGARLQITAPRLGHSILLDAMALESLTWQDMSLFSQFLSQPFGPDDDE